MPRGSKPGERRGGRRRRTPNRRTILTDRILAAASASPKATYLELVTVLVNDDGLPGDTRIAIARKGFPFAPSRMNQIGSRKSLTLTEVPIGSATQIRCQALDNSIAPNTAVAARARSKRAIFATIVSLLSVAQDLTANPDHRRKAASGAAQYFLPKNPRGPRRRKFPADECGFSVDPQIARELRDAQLKLACLPPIEETTPDAFARKVRKLYTRIDEIRRSLQCPGPEKYRTKDVYGDKERLGVLRARRMSGGEFIPEEDLEEAIRTARYDSFLVGPEIAARQRLNVLLQKKRVADRGGPSLSPAELTNFRFLSLLFPLPPGIGLEEMNEEYREQILEDHPFIIPRYVVGDPNRPDDFLIFGTPKQPRSP
jgi:hypothetical protein